MAKTTVIVPCAGKSLGYPTVRPKFLLVNPTGNLMLLDAISRLNLANCHLVLTVLKEHDEKYQLQKMFRTFLNGYNGSLCILPKPTQSQAETVYQTIKLGKLIGPIFVKDCDNIFRLGKITESYNYVTVQRLADAGLINASNKSYVRLTQDRLIETIREKEVISDTFSVGGYYFTDAADFVYAFEQLGKRDMQKELYVSMIIRFLIEEKKCKFRIKKISEYIDLETITEWLRYKDAIKTYFIDIDGIVVRNSGEYIRPFWGTTGGIRKNVKTIQRLYKEGNQIILITSRRQSYREITEKQLKKLGIKYHQLVMGLYHSQRVLVNDFSPSNPHPSVIAINLPRDSDELSEYI